jgi:hypothetical protein
MTEATLTHRAPLGFSAEAALNASAQFWFVVTALGQWTFTSYVAAFYGPALLLGGPDGLESFNNLANGHIVGDTAGNAALAGHLLLAVILMGGGPLQLIPQIRALFPTFHRWLGRTYLLTAVVSAVAGLFLIWTRPLFGSLVNNIGTSLDGVLIIVFAAIALRYAIARDMRTHRRWALRLFMVVSAVWFIRVAMNMWGRLTGGLGVDDETFGGPAVVFWHFAQYLLPLAVLELYFRARDGASVVGRYAMAVGLFALTLLMSVGIYGNSVKWLGRLASG